MAPKRKTPAEQFLQEWCARLPAVDAEALTRAVQSRADVARALVREANPPELRRLQEAEALLDRRIEEIRAAGVDVTALEAASADRDVALLVAVGWIFTSGAGVLRAPLDAGPAGVH